MITINSIVDRAVEILKENGNKVDRLSLHMDISATHANGCPLKLKELLEADDFNFLHDICGIIRHIDRKTGKLTNFFWPRYAKPDAKAAIQKAERGEGR